jgi:signal transduction histidine kinase
MRLAIKFKVGLYATVVCAVAFAILAVLVSRVFYDRQVASLDAELTENAQELLDDLEERTSRGIAPYRAIRKDSIPSQIRNRYMRIWNDDGVELYRSTNWKDFEPEALQPGAKTVVIQARNSRIVTLARGHFSVSIGTRLGVIETMVENLNLAFMIALPIVSGIVCIGVFLITRRALHPIEAMTHAAEHISAARPKERLPYLKTGDEIERLSRVLNESFDRLEKAYSASERFSSAASHQLKTPLAILRAGLSELRSCEYLQPGEKENVDDLIQQTRRLTALCEDLLLLAQADAGRLDIAAEDLDLIPLVRGAIDDMEVVGMDANLKVDYELPLELYTKADPRRIAIILQNLGDNAVKYNRPNGEILVNARAEKDRAVVTVSSTGLCVIPEDFERIFERFNRGKTGENLKGHGLGLSIARELARAHGGDLRLLRSDAAGTEFELSLPLVKHS